MRTKTKHILCASTHGSQKLCLLRCSAPQPPPLSRAQRPPALVASLSPRDPSCSPAFRLSRLRETRKPRRHTVRTRAPGRARDSSGEDKNGGPRCPAAFSGVDLRPNHALVCVAMAGPPKEGACSSRRPVTAARLAESPPHRPHTTTQQYHPQTSRAHRHMRTIAQRDPLYPTSPYSVCSVVRLARDESVPL